jgi:hypothetical protein
MTMAEKQTNERVSSPDWPTLYMSTGHGLFWRSAYKKTLSEELHETNETHI